MISSTQLRALKKGSREILRVPSDETVDLPSTSILSKGEIEKICLTKAESKNLITQGGSLDPGTLRTAFNGDLIRTDLFITLMFNNVLFHTNNVVCRTEYPWLPNIARSIVTASQVRPTGGIPFAWLTCGTQLSSYNARVASLIITYGDILHSGTTLADTIYIHYQATVTSPTSGTPSYIAQYCSIPSNKWDPNAISIAAQGASRGRLDIDAVLNALPADERGIPGGLVVNVTGANIVTSSTQTTIPLATVPPSTKLIFASAVRNTEEYEFINLLLAAGLHV